MSCDVAYELTEVQLLALTPRIDRLAIEEKVEEGCAGGVL